MIPNVSLARRDDIQGLRAFAVGGVVIYHLWPTWLPGGYAGVDVFFVISGFLITSLLVKEFNRTGRIALKDFYIRRFWRLIPLAFLVIFVTATLTPFLLPPSQWKKVAIESVASLFYVQNWQLYLSATDYLAAEEAASPLQHFWSLSIEEQFYFIWPLLIVLSVWLAGKLKRIALPKYSLLYLVAAGSFVLSVASILNPVYSPYFLSQVRFWELGAGGLLAIAYPHVKIGPRPGILMASCGVVAIVASYLVLSGATPFPGYAALLPVGGACLVLAGNAGRHAVIGHILNFRPFVFLGDISYSVYLWHWPLIVFYKTNIASEISLVAGLILFLLVILLSMATKVHVEDRFRHGGATSIRQVLVAAAVLCVAGVAVWSYVIYGVFNQKSLIAQHPERYPGAAIYAGLAAPADVGTAPPLALLRFDKSVVYDNGCHLDLQQTTPKGCAFGDPQGAKKVFLVGDSHAVSWLPALDQIARKNGWSLTSFTKSSCGLSAQMMVVNEKPYQACREWAENVLALIARERPDVVVLTQMSDNLPYDPTGTKDRAARTREMAQSLAGMWQRIAASAGHVVVLADTPTWPSDPDVCLMRDAGCATRVPATASADYLSLAAAESPEVSYLDFNKFICPDGTCPAVIGNVIVWRDRHHFTQTYSRSLAKVISDAVVAEVNN